MTMWMTECVVRSSTFNGPRLCTPKSGSEYFLLVHVVSVRSIVLMPMIIFPGTRQNCAFLIIQRNSFMCLQNLQITTAAAKWMAASERTTAIARAIVHILRRSRRKVGKILCAYLRVLQTEFFSQFLPIRFWNVLLHLKALFQPLSLVITENRPPEHTSPRLSQK